MSTYKITNITDTTGKRDFKHNSVLDIDYVDSMVKKTIKIKAGDSVYLTTQKLPMSVHKLRVKGLVTVTEVSPSELASKIGQPKSVEKKSKLPDKSEIVTANVEMKKEKLSIDKKKVLKKEE
jgi:hypothetical protein